jgi:hypothetical protein
MEVTGITPQTAQRTVFVVAMFFVDVVEWVMVRWDCLVRCVVITRSLPIFLFAYSPPPSRYDPPSVFQIETEQLEMLFFDEWWWIDWKIISSIN